MMMRIVSISFRFTVATADTATVRPANPTEAKQRTGRRLSAENSRHRPWTTGSWFAHLTNARGHRRSIVCCILQAIPCARTTLLLGRTTNRGKGPATSADVHLLFFVSCRQVQGQVRVQFGSTVRFGVHMNQSNPASIAGRLDRTCRRGVQVDQVQWPRQENLDQCGTCVWPAESEVRGNEQRSHAGSVSVNSKVTLR